MLNLKAAAAYLGYSVYCLRKVINRSRRSHKVRTFSGPTIEFFQSSPKSTILPANGWNSSSRNIMSKLACPLHSRVQAVKAQPPRRLHHPAMGGDGRPVSQ